MDDFYSSLDEITENERVKETVNDEICCDKRENHLLSDGMIVCRCCNNMITNIIDSAEWRYYGAGDSKSTDPTRCGMPVNQLLPESSVGTSISYRGSHTYKMNKIRKYQQWNGIPYKERSLLKVFEEINRVCNRGELPKVIVNEANSLYKIVSNTKISRGSNRKGVIAACVYFSCKINKVPRSTNEIAHIFSLTIPVMTKGCKKFQEIMQLNKIDINRIQITKTIDIDDFIDRFCNKLKLSDEDINHIKNISKLSQFYNLVNENTPPSMAAGCIYLYTKEYNIDINKEAIADICKISEVTVTKCYKKLDLHKDRLLI